MSAEPSVDPPSLAPFAIDTLERDRATICALDGQLRITYVNQAWRTFSHDNGGTWGDGRWGIGVALLDSVPTVLRSFYERLFERARTSAAPVEHSYECSSATTFRRFRMRIFRCDGGALVVSHSLSQEVSHRWMATPTNERLYRNGDGIIVQCSHCRRVRPIGPEPRRWDWVPDYLAGHQDGVSHGLCPLCVEFHYPAREQDTPPGSPATMQDPSVLVAGGEASVRALIERVLLGAGYGVTQARDAEEALWVLESDPFDVVLLDRSTPGIEKAAAALRGLQPSACIVDVGIAPGGPPAAMRNLVQTPFTPQSLLKALRRALGQTV
jgi:CheY-like chemotaxis protein